MADRVNTVLIPDAAAALSKLCRRTGFSKTDVINRALQMYEFIDAEIREGHALALMDSDGRVQKVKVLP